jgi:hypothetical protein
MPTDLPNLSQLSPAAARYLRGLGLDRIPAHTWSPAVDMKLAVEAVGELSGQGNRLRKPRYEAVVRKLADANIYLLYHTGKKNYGDFSQPLSESDDSPGMEATVRASYHPGGFRGTRMSPLNAPMPSPYGAPSNSFPEEEEEEESFPFVAEVKPFNSFNTLTELTPLADETQAVIEAAADEPGAANLHRLRRRLLKLQGLLRLLGPELAETLAAFWPVNPPTVDSFEEESVADGAPKPSPGQRPLGGLAQLFKNTNDDHEETDCL